jgi:lysyl-tRNA synthetase class 2
MRPAYGGQATTKIAVVARFIELMENSNMEKPSDELTVRQEKLKRLKELGVEPYGRKFIRTHSVRQLIEKFEALASSEEEVSAAGRIMLIRGHGKASFADLQDETGRIQIYVRQDTVGEKGYQIYRLVDMGDFLGVKGTPFETKTGEKSILVKELTVLSKSLKPPPEKWHGLKDVELKYRRRYLDLIANEKAREVFDKRMRIISAIRDFLNKRGYREVETPILQPQAGGASGDPFKTRADALGMDLYLRIAPELYLKRLLVGGWEKIYEINKSFRNEGISPRHSPEFTMLEVYAAYADYEDMMRLTEELVCEAAQTVLGRVKISYAGKEIDLSPPWKRITFGDAMKEKFDIDIERDGIESLKKKLESAGVKLKDKKLSRNQLIRLLSELLTGELPTFITDYPIEFSPLAKRKPDKPGIVERFELFMCGCELANAYSELNDPQEQRERFREQVASREERSIDEDFVTALEYGMPPAAGLGIGIDRLVMMMTDCQSIRDVILFPQLKKAM